MLVTGFVFKVHSGFGVKNEMDERVRGNAGLGEEVAVGTERMVWT